MRKQSLIDTYLDQSLTGPAGRKVPRGCFVFGTATPEGAAEWEALHERQKEMIDRLFDLQVYAQPGYAVGALRSFVEPVVFVPMMGHDTALSFAREMGIHFWLERREDHVQVIGSNGECIASGPVHLADEVGVCVMPNTEPGEVCVMHGGPYGSRAITASVRWTRERERLISALGCKTCNQGEYYRMRGIGVDGKLLCGGGPIAVAAHDVATRFTAMLEVTDA